MAMSLPLRGRLSRGRDRGPIAKEIRKAACVNSRMPAGRPRRGCAGVRIGIVDVGVGNSCRMWSGRRLAARRSYPDIRRRSRRFGESAAMRDSKSGTLSADGIAAKGDGRRIPHQLVQPLGQPMMWPEAAHMGLSREEVSVANCNRRFLAAMVGGDDVISLPRAGFIPRRGVLARQIRLQSARAWLSRASRRHRAAKAA